MGNKSGKVTKLSSTIHCQLLYGNVLRKGCVSRRGGGRQAWELGITLGEVILPPRAEHVPPGCLFGNVLPRRESCGGAQRLSVQTEERIGLQRQEQMWGDVKSLYFIS